MFKKKSEEQRIFYLDINIISDYKRNLELQKIIDKLSSHHIFLWSEIHVKEFAKSINSEHFQKDIVSLENITKGAFVHDNGEKLIYDVVSPIKYVLKNKQYLRDLNVQEKKLI